VYIIFPVVPTLLLETLHCGLFFTPPPPLLSLYYTIPGYSGPWTIYQDTVGPEPYTRIQWALNHKQGYNGPWTIYQDTVGPEPYTRIHWALDHKQR